MLPNTALGPDEDEIDDLVHETDVTDSAHRAGLLLRFDALLDADALSLDGLGLLAAAVILAEAPAVQLDRVDVRAATMGHAPEAVLIAAARRLGRAGHYDPMTTLFEIAVERAYDKPRVLAEYFACLLRHDQCDTARLQLIERALSVVGDSVVLLLDLIAVLNDVRDFRGTLAAVAAYQKTGNPIPPLAYVNIAVAYLGIGRHDEADDAGREAVRQGDLGGHMVVAAVQLRRGLRDAAYFTLCKAMDGGYRTFKDWRHSWALEAVHEDRELSALFE